MNVALTPVSSNIKTGPIPTTVSSNKTCPPSCPLNHANEGGCYAEHGPLAIHWRKVSVGERGNSFDSFIEQLKKFRQGQFWRMNVAGDLYGEGETIDKEALEKLVHANKNKKGFTYTHKYNQEGNLELIKWANDNGFTINLSANNVAHAETLVGKGMPVCTLLPLEYQRKSNQKTGEWLETSGEYKKRLSTLPDRLEKGNKIVVCPATYMDDMSCDKCRLCQKANRSAVIGFPVHGTKKKTAEKVANS